MNTMKHLMGSKYFFSSFSDYKSHDTDYIQILDTNEFKRKRIIRGQGCDYIQLKKKTKDEIIEDALNEKLPLCVGKFLIPEFNQEIGFTIDDLPKIKPLIDRIDEKHLYERIIFESYIENGGFFLTEEQLNKAYQSYKETRGIK